MEKIPTIGLDITSPMFQVRGINDAGAVVATRKLRRDDVAGFQGFATVPDRYRGLCDRTPLARVLMALAYEIPLAPAWYVKPRKSA